jgi:hypothetical protein
VNRRQKYGGAGKSGKPHFSAQLIFLPHPSAGQTSVLDIRAWTLVILFGLAAADWRKPLVLSLSLKLNGQTVVNLVKSSQTDAAGQVAANIMQIL